MPRYDGMDELLQRVRDRLGVMDGDGVSWAGTTVNPPVPVQSEQYESALERLLLLLRDAEQLSGLLSADRLASLTREQREDLQSIMEKVFGQLARCRATLEGLQTRQ